MRYFEDMDIIVHTDYSGSLPVGHPWAHDDVYCCICGTMVHAHNNEAMTQWVEFDGSAACCDCFVKHDAHMDMWFENGQRRKGHKC